MDTTTKDVRIEQLLALLDWQTDFFRNALQGITDKDTHNRLNTKANHVAWLAGSLVQQRFELVQYLLDDKTIQQQADALFSNNQGIQEDITYPSLQQYIADWDAVSPRLHEALEKLDTTKADEKLDMGGMEMTFLEWLTFSIYREANHIGQIALLRRLMNYEPMKYM